MSGSGVRCYICKFAGSTRLEGLFFLCQTHQLVYARLLDEGLSYIEAIERMKNEYDQSREGADDGRGPE